MFTQSLCTSLY